MFSRFYRRLLLLHVFSSENLNAELLLFRSSSNVDCFKIKT